MQPNSASRHLIATASAIILVAFAAVVGMAQDSRASTAAKGDQNIQASSCDQGSGYHDLPPSPYDVGGTNARTWCYGYPHLNAQVEFLAAGEHLRSGTECPTAGTRGAPSKTS